MGRLPNCLALLALGLLSACAGTTWDTTDGADPKQAAYIDQSNALIHELYVGVVDGKAKGFGKPGPVVLAPGRHVIGISLNKASGRILPDNPGEKHEFFTGLSSVVHHYVELDAQPGAHYSIAFHEETGLDGKFGFWVELVDRSTGASASTRLGNFYNPPP
jgi:hypothetical protein